MRADADVRRVVLLRHGRTAWNAQRRIQGQLDAPLDATGRAQAAEAAVALAAYEPVGLWTSDLSRAADTAGHLSRQCGLVPTVDRRLREFHVGDREGLTHAEYAAAFPEEYARFATGRLEAAAGAESVAAVAARMSAAVADAVAGIGVGETAVMVSHGAASRVAVAALTGLPWEAVDRLVPLGNCCWAVLDRRESSGDWRLAAYNLSAPSVLRGPAEDPDFASATGVG